MRAVLLLVVLGSLNGVMGVNASQAPAPGALEPGVSETLARDRANRVRDVRYDLALDVPAATDGRVKGRETITFTLSDTSAPLAIDFEPNAAGALHTVTVNGNAQSAALAHGHIVLPAQALRVGENRVAITFDAGDAPLNRNEAFLYTIFVPARAHEAIPCFDQPDLKARWTLTLDVPESWETLANGEERSRHTSGGRTRLSFAETLPISTYLFAFASGRFQVERAERNGRTFRMFHRETDGQKVVRNLEAIFNLHAAALDSLERYTGIPYPFGKFDFVLVPAFQFGGMEHPGAIFYNAAGLMLDESATQNQKLERASTIAHESAHMWFGDLVTMRWFNDVWMKEVFANFMAAKIVNPSFPEINHDLRFLLSHYPAAYDVDRTAGTNAIRQPLDNLKDAGTLYGAIIYQKAPIVMRQLEALVGADSFRDGLREYLRRYSFGNASWSDLLAFLDARTPEDLAAWSHGWVDERGRPIITTDLDTADGKISRLAFRVRDPYEARGLSWTQNLKVALGYGGRVTALPVHLNGSQVDVPAARGLPAPDFVLPSGDGIGYGEFHLDSRSLGWLSGRLADVADPLVRGAAWVTLWDAVLNRELPAARFIDLALAALPLEDDELNTQQILGGLQQSFWRFSDENVRTQSSARLERTLLEALARARTASLKGAYFAALRNTATTMGTIEWLTRVWRGDESIPGLTLAENDFIALAQELAVRQVPDWRRVLDQQVARTQNPDRKARLQFVIPALSADPAERERFFVSLRAQGNRRHEPWVLDGLGYLHHPLRAAASLKYLQPSLELLVEVQRTGDIFFPKRWMDQTLGGHRSPEAASVVRSFVDRSGPSYPDRLRRIILSSADALFRASRM